MRTYLGWALAIIPAAIFFQSLFFKFSGSEETEIIFGTIGSWMEGIPVLASIAPAFASHGGLVIGGVELIAGIALLIPATRFWGALLGICTISGAIFFHLATPLGVDRVVDAAGNTDGGVLFYMACLVWVCCAATLALSRRPAPAAA